MVGTSEKAMATHSSTLAWKIPWTEEPGRLQSMGSLRVRHDWATSLSLFTFMRWRRKWQPTPVFCLENPRDGGAWWAAVSGITQSRTRLKWLSSSSSSSSRGLGTKLGKGLHACKQLGSCSFGNGELSKIDLYVGVWDNPRSAVNTWDQDRSYSLHFR